MLEKVDDLPRLNMSKSCQIVKKTMNHPWILALIHAEKNVVDQKPPFYRWNSRMLTILIGENGRTFGFLDMFQYKKDDHSNNEDLQHKNVDLSSKLGMQAA